MSALALDMTVVVAVLGTVGLLVEFALSRKNESRDADRIAALEQCVGGLEQRLRDLERWKSQ